MPDLEDPDADESDDEGDEEDGSGDESDDDDDDDGDSDEKEEEDGAEDNPEENDKVGVEEQAATAATASQETRELDKVNAGPDASASVSTFCMPLSSIAAHPDRLTI